MGNYGKEQLEELIREARRLLENKSGCHTRADESALADMIARAESALKGKKVPFTRNREFFKLEEDQEICFAYDRYTMAPTAFEKGKVYGHYGLKEATEWFRRQDMSKWSMEKLEERRQEVLERSGALLAKAKYGDETGAYGLAEGKALRAQMERLSAARPGDMHKNRLCEILADTVNTFWDMRFSQRLQSDVRKKPALLLTEKERNELPDRIASSPFVKAQFDAIKAIADRETLWESKTAYEQIWEKRGYPELNASFRIWGDTGRVVNLVTPPGTRKVRISFRLPAMENRENGLGHVWLTDIRIFAADGPEVTIPNRDFRLTDGQGGISNWQSQRKGKAFFRQEQDGEGNSSLFLCNPTGDDEILIRCEDDLPISENCGYTLFFRVKQDGKLHKGLLAVLEFLDEKGSVTGQFTHTYNRKSVLPTGPKALSMQCNAILYELEGNPEYAQKAKYDMLTFLNDFCQGAEYWMTFNERPEGCDAYGAVQAGRIMCAVASTFSLIREADVFSMEDEAFFYGMTDYLLQYCLDMRDRISMSPGRAQEGASNWQTDMCIGVCALMAVMPDYPGRKTWLYNAAAVLEAQLSVNLNRDGSWPESIRYHHAALEHFASFARIWKQETGEDWLLTTRLKEMFRYTIHTLTPPYAYFDGRTGTPPFGDHRLSGGEELGIYGLYLEWIGQTDRKLEDEMYQAWMAAKWPVKSLKGESVVLENLLYAEPSTYRISKEHTLALKSSGDYPDSGIYVFRNGRQKENYLAVMAAPRPIGHGHFDTGSFLLYYHNYPVIMDSGIEGYFDASTQWHLSSYSHACLQFAATEEEMRSLRVPEGGMINLNAGNYSLDRGWLDVPRIGLVKEVSIGEEYDSIDMEITHPCGREKGIHKRTIRFRKETGEVAITDRVENYKGKILFSLPMVMKSGAVNGNLVRTEGYYPLRMDIEFQSPMEEIMLDKGRTTPMFPSESDTPMLLYVRARAQAENGVEVRIRIREN